MSRSKIDLIELARLYVEERRGITSLAKHFGVRPFSVDKALTKLGIKDSSRQTGRKVPADEELIRLYVVEKMGLHRMSCLLDVHQTIIHRHITRLGVLDPSRQYLPSGEPRRRRRLKSQEFTNATKRARFAEEGGVCQECRGLIGVLWQDATYHHRINCKDGGTADPSNAVVLHPSCHNDPVIFRRLHGFSIDCLQSGY